MKMNFSFIPVFMLLGIFSCNDDNSTKPEETVPLGDPVETQQPNTNYKPAFEGQTRIGSVKTTTNLKIDVIATDLVSPWAIVAMPNNNLLVTQKGGSMKIFSETGTMMTEVLGFPAVDDGGQGGMLDVALDPDFETNRMIYWSFSEPFGNGNLTSIAKGKLSSDEKSIENPTIIYRAEPSYNGSLHYGSRLAFDDAGNLYATTGERSDLATRPQAQQLDKALGKIVRITKNGQPVSGNPFMGTANANDEIYSYGHRNPQGLAFHPVTKQLWESEFGAKGGDEINFVEPGKNYGWPVISYGLEYNGNKIGEGITQKDGMEQPVYYWDPSVSPSGMDFYTGNAVPEWQHNLFLGALSGQHIIRLVIKNNKVAGEERLLADKNERFRDVLASHQNQSLYAVTDSGKIYRISKN